MYNLFITANCEAWNGSSEKFNVTRCLCEYTDDALKEQFSDLTDASIALLQQYPCLFAHEGSCGKPARLGYITGITKRKQWIRIEYRLDQESPLIPIDTLTQLEWDLDIKEWEMNRTHWALKEVDLYTALAHANIEGYEAKGPLSPVDIATSVFDVALTFSGENRVYVQAVAERLALLLGRNRVFFDDFYKPQLARPNLDTFLQDIYLKRSRLIVVFLCESYALKDWCGIEFRIVREIIKQREDDKVMFVRHDNGHVDGVFSTDGYIDATQYTPKQVADMIRERVRLKQNNIED